MRRRFLIYGALAFLGGVSGDLLLRSGFANAAPQDKSPFAILGQLGRVVALIENEYVDPVERSRLVEGAIKGMVDELDPHSTYLPPAENQIAQNDIHGEFGGIGVEVDLRGDVVLVMAPMEGGPAERAGVKSGDKIVAVDNEDARTIGVDKMTRRMRGPAGTKVKITVQREGARELLQFELVREVIKVAAVSSKRLDGGIAYVRIKQFQERTHDDLLKEVGKLRAGGPIAGVILDLRGNPGGLVDEAAEVADEFLEDGAIYSARHRGQITDEVRAHGGGAFAKLPAVVLVNEWSASASELVAGALQDHGRATVVGTNTFGKGSVQTILELPGGAGIHLTTARYYTPSGHAIQGDGVHPDVLIDNSRVTKSKLPIIREKDFENALPPEGFQVRDAGAVLVAPAPPDGGAADEGASVRDVPNDPRTGTDFTLRVGYEVLARR